MATKKIILSAFSLLFCLSIGSSQIASGLIFGEFNGINATKINPSSAFNSSQKWDVQIGGGHVFFQTNYGYINKSNLFNTISNSDEIEIHNYPDDPVENAAPLSVIFSADNSNTFTNAKAEVFGPGFMFQLNPKIKLGIFTRGRAFASLMDFPDELNYYNLNNTIVNTQYDANKFTSGTAGWNEIGLLYAQKISKNIILGASFKYNVGISGANFRFENSFSFTSNDLQTFNPVGFGEYRISYAEIDSDLMNGNGFGLDLGITINNIFSKGTSLGISILDLGYTKFNGRSLFVSYDQTHILERSNYSSLNDPNELLDQITTDFYARREFDEVFIDHPTTISIQYLHTINKRVKIQAVFNQGINIKKSEYIKGTVYPSGEIEGPNSLLATGIYETKNISVFLPMTLVNYDRINTGLAFRAYFLTIGSDDIGSLFGRRNFDGTDIYINLNIYPFLVKKADKVPCFSF